jgi:hypothetical protein
MCTNCNVQSLLEDLDSDDGELDIELDREFDELVSDNEDASNITNSITSTTRKI